MDLRLFATLLGVALIIMRIAGIIDWHWMLVLFPFWPVMAIVAFLALVWAIAGLVWLVSTPEQRAHARAVRELRAVRRFFGLKPRVA